MHMNIYTIIEPHEQGVPEVVFEGCSSRTSPPEGGRTGEERTALKYG